ncbi:ABC transporter permease [Adhaeribacter pallidiroseus]|uniref:Macrolide export ATP-binding/permease protein MacB n=1 Tax=Adhaeribacter pallidiroseus TaxID=2072847 RepID=A0A369QM58_9BACT|nr:ABC transporter permease [Adhaeribacter pallidiroseus]RDC65452.1 Macrolide export ATP-binding/permease protein MacB [Adhaeribacter pallidiroseus]
MLTNYLKLAVRNLLRQKFYTAINVAGLTLGVAGCLLIFMFVQNELSYDKFHANGNRIYRLLRNNYMNGKITSTPYTSGPYAPTLAADFPEDIQAAVRVMANNALVTYGDKSFNEDRFYFTDPQFFEVFSFKLLKGNPRTALAEPNTLVITEAMAKKYFGKAEPMGKLVTINKDQTFKVTGVMANVPGNSQLQFDMLSSIKLMENEDYLKAWRANMLYTYLLLPEAGRHDALQSKMPGFVQKYLAETMRQFSMNVKLTLQPFQNVYLDDSTTFDFTEHGNKNNVYIFSAIAIFILLIACINFMNLASARSVGRAKEVGVRKVLGAYQRHLIGQFLVESVLLATVSVVLAVALIYAVLPAFNTFAEKQLTLPVTNPLLYVFLILVAIVVGLLAGSYPAFFLSSFQPVKVLKGRLSGSSGNPFIRKALVVFQFAVSIFLIIGTVVIFRQMQYVQNKQLGFGKENILKVPVDNGDIDQKLYGFMRQVRQLPEVKNVSVMSGEPGGFHDRYTIKIVEKPEEDWSFRTVFTDYDYIATLGIKLVAGRGFSRNFPTDSVSAIILNEAAVKQIGWTPQNALGKEFLDVPRDGEASPIRLRVIGVVKDYNFSSLKEAIQPLAIMMRNDHRVIAIKLGPGNPQQAVAAIQNVYTKVAPKYPFEFTFLDQDFDKLYKNEQKQAVLFTLFATLAICIACLGLFGLALYSTEQRRKEVGIRKVLGASVSGVVALLSKDFLKLVLLANVLAWPLAYWAMHKWLQEFTYRTELNAFIFIAAGIIALVIAIITVSFQAVKVAIANPVNALRDE